MKSNSIWQSSWHIHWYGHFSSPTVWIRRGCLRPCLEKKSVHHHCCGQSWPQSELNKWMNTYLSPSKYCYTWNSWVILENNTCHMDETCTPSYSQCIVKTFAHGLWCLQLWREWTKIVRRMVWESSWDLSTITILFDHHATWAANICIW